MGLLVGKVRQTGAGGHFTSRKLRGVAIILSYRFSNASLFGASAITTSLAAHASSIVHLLLFFRFYLDLYLKLCASTIQHPETFYPTVSRSQFQNLKSSSQKYTVRLYFLGLMPMGRGFRPGKSECSVNRIIIIMHYTALHMKTIFGGRKKAPKGDS